VRRGLLLGLAALVALLVWWGSSRPVAVPGAVTERLPSLSFSPYRRGQSPLIGRYPSEAELAEDIARVATVAEGVRVYTSLEGFDRIPRLAAAQQLTVTMGAWLGSDPQHNRREVEALIAVANAYPQTVRRVIVGNETVVRHEITPAELIALLREVRARVAQPVSYADVPIVWRHHPELAAEVDFITVHILPYWEDRAVAFADAERYLRSSVSELGALFPGQPLFIGEVGWPADGRPRGPALASRPHQAGMVRMVARVGRELHLDYNLIEAFDQPWKGALEGRVGAHWGLFGADRQLKYPASGPIDPLPEAPWLAALAVTLGAGLGWLALRRPATGPGGTLLLALALQGLAALAVLAGWRALGNAFVPAQYLWALGVAVVAALLLLLSALNAAAALGTARPAQVRWAGPWLLWTAQGLLLFHAQRLTFTGHLRDIPTALPLLVVGCMALTVVMWRGAGNPWRAALWATLLPQPTPPSVAVRGGAAVVALMLCAAALGVVGAEALEAAGADFGRPAGLAERIALAVDWWGANPSANLWGVALLGLALPALLLALPPNRR